MPTFTGLNRRQSTSPYDSPAHKIKNTFKSLAAVAEEIGLRKPPQKAPAPDFTVPQFPAKSPDADDVLEFPHPEPKRLADGSLVFTSPAKALESLPVRTNAQRKKKKVVSFSEDTYPTHAQFVKGLPENAILSLPGRSLANKNGDTTFIKIEQDPPQGPKQSPIRRKPLPCKAPSTPPVLPANPATQDMQRLR
jgi:hypothetical protein